MTLNLCSPCPWFSRFSFPSPPYKYSSLNSNNRSNTAVFYFVFTKDATSFKNRANFMLSASKIVKAKASLSESSISELLDDDGDELINRVSAVKDADEALEVIAERTKRSGGVVCTSDCCSIISAAIDRNNADLALSIFYAMRSSFDTAFGEKGVSVERWRWSRPDVHTYTLLVQGLAASLKVSDALRMIANVCRVGVSPGEEVPFGKIVRCPSCMIAVAVAQPQHGLQIVSCSKCRYQYELVSGNIINIESEEIRISSCRTQHGCSCMEKGAKIPSNNETKHSCCCSLHCDIMLRHSRSLSFRASTTVVLKLGDYVDEDPVKSWEAIADAQFEAAISKSGNPKVYMSKAKQKKMKKAAREANEWNLSKTRFNYHSDEDFTERKLEEAINEI